MGFFRFRKSIRIAPGIRLSLSKRGLGVSAGVRGFRASMGSRGLGLTAGIPGTGLSYSMFSGSGSRSTGGRSSYRELQRSQREEQRRAIAAARAQEKAAALAAARAEHEAHETQIGALRSVLREREVERFAWSELVACQGPFVPVPFVPPAFAPPPGVVRGRVATRHPVWGWVFTGVVSLLAAGFLSVSGIAVAFAAGAEVGTRLVAGAIPILLALVLAAVAVACTIAALGATRRRPAEMLRVLAEMEGEHARQVDDEREAHAEAQAREAREWAADEVAREELRDAASRQDPEPLAHLLAAELENEDFPIPVVCDADFDGCERVAIWLELPDLDDVPDERTSLTSTGKLSRKKMAQRDRVAIYEDLCCGVALRLTHEAFRVIPALIEVMVEGVFTQPDATGKDTEGTALRFTVTRTRFLECDLDKLDPSDAVRALGVFNCSRKGELEALR
ncbi:MAG: DUF4236 domain-containing protein [Myxococcota bacterium]